MERLSTRYGIPYREKVIDGLKHCVKDGCEGCPYEHDCTQVAWFAEVAKDALELLTPRVLALQECYEAPFVWLESKDGCGVTVVKIRVIMAEPGMLAISSFDWPMKVNRESNYGKTFRCWNQYPIGKYREAAKWG